MAIIYALTCVVTNRAYIGCTTAKLNKRAREHRCLLRNGKHTSRLLQEEWDRHGEANFQMVILETVDCDSLKTKRAAEQKWIDRYSAAGLLCNAYETSFAPSPEQFRAASELSHKSPNAANRWSKEANLKRRFAQLGKPKGHGAKISATKRLKREQRLRDDMACSV